MSSNIRQDLPVADYLAVNADGEIRVDGQLGAGA